MPCLFLVSLDDAICAHMENEITCRKTVGQGCRPKSTSMARARTAPGSFRAAGQASVGTRTRACRIDLRIGRRICRLHLHARLREGSLTAAPPTPRRHRDRTWIKPSLDCYITSQGPSLLGRPPFPEALNIFPLIDQRARVLRAPATETRQPQQRCQKYRCGIHHDPILYM
jgi:hypothetical protein